MVSIPYSHIHAFTLILLITDFSLKIQATKKSWFPYSFFSRGSTKGELKEESNVKQKAQLPVTNVQQKAQLPVTNVQQKAVTFPLTSSEEVEEKNSGENFFKLVLTNTFPSKIQLADSCDYYKFSLICGKKYIERIYPRGEPTVFTSQNHPACIYTIPCSLVNIRSLTKIRGSTITFVAKTSRYPNAIITVQDQYNKYNATASEKGIFLANLGLLKNGECVANFIGGSTKLLGPTKLGAKVPATLQPIADTEVQQQTKGDESTKIESTDVGELMKEDALKAHEIFNEIFNENANEMFPENILTSSGKAKVKDSAEKFFKLVLTNTFKDQLQMAESCDHYKFNLICNKSAGEEYIEENDPHGESTVFTSQKHPACIYTIPCSLANIRGSTIKFIAKTSHYPNADITVQDQYNKYNANASEKGVFLANLGLQKNRECVANFMGSTNLLESTKLEEQVPVPTTIPLPDKEVEVKDSLKTQVPETFHPVPSDEFEEEKNSGENFFKLVVTNTFKNKFQTMPCDNYKFTLICGKKSIDENDPHGETTEFTSQKHKSCIYTIPCSLANIKKENQKKKIRFMAKGSTEIFAEITVRDISETYNAKAKKYGIFLANFGLLADGHRELDANYMGTSLNT